MERGGKNQPFRWPQVCPRNQELLRVTDVLIEDV